MVALTIAGSDSGGGAGIQADIKTFQELGVFGTSVLTALTAQNTVGVHGIYEVTPSFVKQQLEAVLTDLPVRAIKTGMLFSQDIIHTVADTLRHYRIPLIVDPVMIAKGGQSLLQDCAVEAMIQKLLPITTVCTPNIPEAEVLTGLTIRNDQEIEQAANMIINMGVQCVVIKGGHLSGEDATDTVFLPDMKFTMTTPRFQTKDTHGTGCTFSAAITANMAKGLPLKKAIIESKRFIQLAISNPLHIGKGHGPTNHFAFNKGTSNCEVLIREG